MGNILKLCPLCEGSMLIDIGSLLTHREFINRELCPLEQIEAHEIAWNNRPTEDAFQARIANLEAAIKSAIPRIGVYNSGLTEDIIAGLEAVLND